jgi:hypothetical protein
MLRKKLFSLALLGGIALAACERTVTELELAAPDRTAMTSTAGALNEGGNPDDPTLASAAVPAAPANLQASAASSSQINLQWTDNSGNEDGFEVWRTRGGGQHTLVVRTGPNVTSYSDTGVEPGTTYFYGVVAFNAAGTSSPSNPASATTPAAPPPPPPYNPNSPHWTHFRLATTAWGVQPIQSEIEHVARHYDLVMSGPLNQFHQLNPTAIYMPYTILWHLPRPGGSYPPALDVMYYHDMQQWYADPAKNTGGWDLEHAFLHSQHPRTEANRLLTPVEPHSPWWQERRWVMNPTDPGFRAYTIDRYRRILETAYLNAIFIDEHSWEIDLMDGSVEHTPQSLRNGIATFYAAIRPALNNAMLMLNTANYHPELLGGAWIVDAVRNAGGVHMESLIELHRDLPYRWDAIERFAATGALVKPTSNTTRAQYNQGGSVFPPGNHATRGDRGKMFELTAVYMALTTPEQVYFSPAPHGTYVESWYPPYERNVGSAQGSRTLYFSGLDGAGQMARVFSRQFTNALVLNRPIPTWSANPNFSNASAVTVTLPPGTWYRVRDDNTLEPTPSTSIQLRLAEGAIFMRG